MLGITNLPQCSVLMLWDFCAAMQLRTKHSVVFIIHCICVLSIVQCTFVYGGPKMATFPAYCRASSLVKCERSESHCTEHCITLYHCTAHCITLRPIFCSMQAAGGHSGVAL